MRKVLSLFCFVALAGCSSGDVYETATISLGSVRCSENIRVKDGNEIISLDVANIPIGSSEKATGRFSLGLPYPGEGKNEFDQRCQDIVDTAKSAAELEREKLVHEVELLRLEAELEAVRLEREKDEVEHLKNGLNSDW